MPVYIITIDIRDIQINRFSWLRIVNSVYMNVVIM